MGKKVLCIFVAFVFLCTTSISFAFTGNEHTRPAAQSLSSCLEEISAAIERGNYSAEQVSRIIGQVNCLLQDLNSDEVIIEQNQCEIEWFVVIQQVLYLLRSVYTFIVEPSVGSVLDIVINALGLIINYLEYIECLSA